MSPCPIGSIEVEFGNIDYEQNQSKFHHKITRVESDDYIVEVSDVDEYNLFDIHHLTLTYCQPVKLKWVVIPDGLENTCSLESFYRSDQSHISSWEYQQQTQQQVSSNKV